MRKMGVVEVSETGSEWYELTCCTSGASEKLDSLRMPFDKGVGDGRVPRTQREMRLLLVDEVSLVLDLRM